MGMSRRCGRVGWLKAGVLLLWVMLGAMVVAAEEDSAAPQNSVPADPRAAVEAVLDAKLAAGAFSRQGADTCLKCHDAGSELPASGIFATPHGRLSDPNGPFAGLQCEACHGPAGNHPRRPRSGQTREPMITFGPDSPVPAAKQNAVCLACHTDAPRMAWHSGIHALAEVTCSSCHRLHQTPDPALKPLTQIEVCTGCHHRQKSELHQRSAHPLGVQMGCTDCHNPHQSVNESSLRRLSLNETCYGCHAEKRGPFLWEHAPVVEDCSYCHRPHGSINRALLSQRPPQLCQDCHAAAGHPAVAYSGPETATGRPSAFVLGGSCLNCHSQVHGSNHPSGHLLQR